MKNTIILVMIAALLLTSCAADKGVGDSSELMMPTEPLSNLSNTSIADNSGDSVYRVAIMDTLDATSIRRIKILNNSTAFIIAVKRDKSKGQLEVILAKCNLSEKKVNSLFRTYMSCDGNENMRVAESIDGQETVFSGRGIWVNNTGYQPLPDFVPEASYHIHNHQYAYVNSETLDLYIGNMETGLSRLIYKSAKAETESDQEDIMKIIQPYMPIISEDGQKVLFQLIEYESYKKVVCCDMVGTILGETPQLDVRADSLQTFWMGDRFFTVESTDSSKDTITNDATYITVYNYDGTVEKTFNYESAISSIQNEKYPEHSLLAFNLEKGLPDSNKDIYQLGIINMESGDACTVYETENVIISPTVSPDGSKVVWVEDGSICTMSLEGAKSTPIDTFELTD
ncbi:MAG: hypothetical protein ACERKO_08990 [Acetanaerobacterium sp.]